MFDPNTPLGLGVIIGISAGGFVLLVMLLVVLRTCRRTHNATASKTHWSSNAAGVEMGYNTNPMGTDGRPVSRPPTVPRPVSIATPTSGSLPTGWVATVDVGSGDTYYYNEVTGESQWEVPEHDRQLSAPRNPQQEGSW